MEGIGIREDWWMKTSDRKHRTFGLNSSKGTPMNESNQDGVTDRPLHAAQEQAGEQIRLRIDERKMASAYANGFRTHNTAEEVVIDFGMNLALPTTNAGERANQDHEQTREMVFEVNHRVIMNYYTAKRLAILLGRTVQAHEQQFGELKLNAAERVDRASSQQPDTARTEPSNR